MKTKTNNITTNSITENRCFLCSRQCGADRTPASLGFCRVGSTIKVARAALHMWEEPCISGEEGSGAVFFSGCSLQCVYCQNRSISTGQTGIDVTEKQLAEIFIDLQNQKANNINLVTPGHYINRIKTAIEYAREDGLNIPIVYNTGSYETVEALNIMNSYANIYLPDMKYYDDTLAIKYSKAPDYNKIALANIREMLRQVGTPEFDSRGMMTKGVIVRHLMLPGYLEDSKKVIKQLYDNFGDDIYISIMNQYTPLDGVKDYPELTRKVSDEEYDELVDYAISIGVENGFIQEGETADESFIPDFDMTGLEKYMP